MAKYLASNPFAFIGGTQPNFAPLDPLLASSYNSDI